MDHAELRAHVPELELDLAEFVRARLVVASRVFAFSVGGVPSACLVPLGDLVDHASPGEAAWCYSDAAEAYTLTASTALAAGAPIRQSYGPKSSARQLLSYGFVIDANDDDEATFRFEVGGDVPSGDARRRLLRLAAGTARTCFEVPFRHDHPSARAMLSFLRVLAATGDELVALDATPTHAAGTGPLNAPNEARALALLASACERGLAAFPTSLEEDDRLLATPGLSPNARNCIVNRKGEKRVLRRYLQLSGSATTVLAGPASDTGGLTAVADAWGGAVEPPAPDLDP